MQITNKALITKCLYIYTSLYRFLDTGNSSYISPYRAVQYAPWWQIRIHPQLGGCQLFYRKPDRVLQWVTCLRSATLIARYDNLCRFRKREYVQWRRYSLPISLSIPTFLMLFQWKSKLVASVVLFLSFPYNINILLNSSWISMQPTINQSINQSINKSINFIDFLSSSLESMPFC